MNEKAKSPMRKPNYSQIMRIRIYVGPVSDMSHGPHCCSLGEGRNNHRGRRKWRCTGRLALSIDLKNEDDNSISGRSKIKNTKQRGDPLTVARDAIKLHNNPGRKCAPWYQTTKWITHKSHSCWGIIGTSII